MLGSGYEEETESIRQNPMLFYYEPLSVSLARTRRQSITVVGHHSDVVISIARRGGPNNLPRAEVSRVSATGANL